MRLQLFGALLIPFLLVATLLYLWRRPRAEPDAAALALVDAGFDAASSAEPRSSASESVKVSGTPPGPVSLGDIRVISCHDSGPKKTSADQCDRLTPVEQGLARAIQESASCLPESAGSGTIEYMLDVSFGRKKAPIQLTLPKAGRSFRNPKLVMPCAQAVRAKVTALSLDGLTHAHGRYKLSVIATYGSPR